MFNFGSKRVLIGVFMALSALSAVTIFHSWAEFKAIDHQSGAWTAMAIDLASGLFYRPAESASGFGAMGMFPLHIAVQGAFIKSNLLNALGAGLTVSIISALLTGSAIFFICRKITGAGIIAFAAAVVVLGTGCFRYGISSIGPDMLATGLGLWGCYFCAFSHNNLKALTLASILSSLAFSTMAASFVFPLAGALGLLGRKEYRKTIIFTALTIVFSACALFFVQYLSDNRFLSSVLPTLFTRLTTSGLFTEPSKMITLLVEKDLGGLVVFVLGMFSFLTGVWRAADKTWYVLFALIVVISFFTSNQPGGNFHYLVNLISVSIIMYAAKIANTEARTGQQTQTTLTLVGMICLAVIIGDLIPDITNRKNKPDNKADYMQFVYQTADLPDPILAEDAMIPILAGRPVYLINNLIFNYSKDKEKYRNSLIEKIANREFSAVILKRYTESKAKFGLPVDEFLTLLKENYEWKGLNDRFVFFTAIKERSL